jgi:hypothetical protein
MQIINEPEACRYLYAVKDMENLELEVQDTFVNCDEGEG